MSRLFQRSRWPLWLGALLWPGLSACGGEELTVGWSEPLRVIAAQFHDGRLPGSAPLTSAEVRAGVSPESPALTSFDLSGLVLYPGQPGKAIRGRASADAAAIGVRFADLGSGYWVRPVGAPDSAFAGEYTWQINFDVSHDLRPGLRALLFAAIDERGHAGSQTEFELCVASAIPDNLNACDPKRAPPNTVISLEWDADLDLDLELVTPDGKLVGPKNPTTALEDAKGNIDPSAAGTGKLDRDAVAGCNPAGPRRENLVFQEPPSVGRYRVYANLYDACAEASVRFRLSFHGVTAGAEPDSFRQAEIYSIAGVQLGVQANAGRQRGQFLTEFVVE